MKGKLNNRGYSLVELLLTLAIFSFVMLGIAMIMRTTSVSYKDGANEVTMQTEAQIVANQIEEIFMDGTKGYCSGYIDGNKYYGITSDGASHFIILQATDQKLWYQIKGSGETTPDSQTSGDWSLMAQNVVDVNMSGYSDDVSSASCDNMINVVVKLDRDGYVYSASKDIYFRNSIENKTVTQIKSDTSESDSDEVKFLDVYVDRYQVVDLVKEYELDLSKDVTIKGFGASTYKLVEPTYNTGNKEKYKAIAGIKDVATCIKVGSTTEPVGDNITDQVAYCKAKSVMAFTTTGSLNASLSTAVDSSSNVTIVGTSLSGSPIKLRIQTKVVQFNLNKTNNGADGVIQMTADGESLPRYNYIYVDGFDYTSMMYYGNLSFRYVMVVYIDADGDNKFDAGENTASGSTVALRVHTKDDLSFDYTQGFDLEQEATYPQVTLGLMPDPEGSDILFCAKSPLTQPGDIAVCASGSARVAMLIETPSTAGNTYDLVDVPLLVQGSGYNLTNYDKAYSSDATADYFGTSPF